MKAVIQNRYSKLLGLVTFGFVVFFIGLSIRLPKSAASPAGPNQGGFVYQNFENNSGIIFPWNGSASTTTIRRHSGTYALYLHGDIKWNGVGLRAQSGNTNVDFVRENNDRLTFWIYALPDPAGTNPVFVKFFDNYHYIYPNGVQAQTTQIATAGVWTKLQVLFNQLPPDFDFHHVERVEFMNEWPGIYYLDDIEVVHEDRVYQSFEPDKRGLSLTATDEFGWVWNGMTNTLTNTCNLSGPGDPVYAGQHSWKIELHDYWAGTGIKSEQEYFSPTTSPTTGQQSFWNVNLDPKHNDQLSFWVYAVPANGLDNNVNIQFFDRVTRAITVDGQLTFTDKVEYWTNKPAITGQWTRLTVPFSELLKITPTLMLTNLDKIQFQMFWPGDYYLDDIKAASSVPQWDKSTLKDGLLRWKSNYPLNRYVLQENRTGAGALSNTGWTTIYIGTSTTQTITRISQTWYRVRAEEVQDISHEIPFISDWSDVLEYSPPLIVIDKSELDQKLELTWTKLSRAISYEVQSAIQPTESWQLYYSGAYPLSPLTATTNTRYRVRAWAGSEASDWSPALWKPDPPDQDLLQAQGTTIRKKGGEIVTLRGVNLGNYLLVEPWMNDWSRTVSGTEIYTDDFTIRQILTERLGATETYTLFEMYRDAFLTETDFDILQRMGLNFVRLPIYYIDLQDGNGISITKGFDRIDRVVNACADRGMYVLLDLHGAPGSQSKELHTGRACYNMLFTDTVTGTNYQSQTVQLWQDIATHYKDNPTVVGYDLLNEPTGVITGSFACTETLSGPNDAQKQKLWDFYGRLYSATREIDPDHIIMMEGIWDWDTLPKPSDRNWQNVVYQFHYYHFCDEKKKECPPDLPYPEYVTDHIKFINEKVAIAHQYQYSYQVPAMIGEFNAFESREAWDYYLSKFNELGWSWAIWSYKVSWPNSRWGLLTDQSHSPDDRPDFGSDPTETLRLKMSAPFDTLSRYIPSYSLIETVKSHLRYRIYLPLVQRN